MDEIFWKEFDSLKHQNEYTKTFYYDADKLTMEQRKEITRQQVLGLIGELIEFQEGTKLLPWKSNQNDINHDNTKEELIDVYHFFMNLCNLWGIRDDFTLKDIYLKKNKINYRRGKMHEKPNENFKA